ncbi:hypothetical protein [Halomonas sp. HAL1]|uniref:hypothetical protein n=1 Tax=Halomonas sp. HAL1 TaxID=550984 RepID=UPI00022D2BFF|nr:hypothetical protein [Halomonas sp. HAL1]EHA17677.1 hypothetical protein HAL1_00565 [Halomonas sp. HAL1]WKV92142.1 hypothetical protein Q3Y66_14920 [Halomonas sp. HAL1]
MEERLSSLNALALKGYVESLIKDKRCFFYFCLLNSPLSLVSWADFLTKVNDNFGLLINRLGQGARAIAKKSMAS